MFMGARDGNEPTDRKDQRGGMEDSGGKDDEVVSTALRHSRSVPNQ